MESLLLLDVGETLVELSLEVILVVKRIVAVGIAVADAVWVGHGVMRRTSRSEKVAKRLASG